MKRTFVEIPDPSRLLVAIEGVTAEYDRRVQSISEWREEYLRNIAAYRRMSKLRMFHRFANNLLERAVPGESFERRLDLSQTAFASFDEVTTRSARRVLKKSGYRFPDAGAHVIMDAKRVVADPTFTWRGYVDQAERGYEADFPEDRFRDIKGVNFKTRDLALSELTDRFIAVDLHVVRVVSRTGLLLSGYGDPRISTDVSKEQSYLFFHGLMIELSRKTGWPGSGYSPGEIDRMIWHFGRTACEHDPNCNKCILKQTCLTGLRRRA